MSLVNSQHGFRQSLSAEVALLEVTDKIDSNIECKKISLLSLHDISKAFDSVNHTLVKKCTKLGIYPLWFRDHHRQ